MNKSFCAIFLTVTAIGVYLFSTVKSQSPQDMQTIQAPQKILQKVMNNAGTISNKKILDYGCGCGRMVGLLLRNSAQPHSLLAVDSDTEAIKDVESLYADFILKGMLKTQLINNPKELGSQKFDLIFCHNVLEYVEDAVGFIKNLYVLLEPNGVLILSHQDFDSEIFNSSYRDLTRELVHYFADNGEVGQTHCDGQIARKIPGIFKRAGIENVAYETWRVVETAFTQNDYGSLLAEMIVKSASQKFDAAVLADWLKDLESKANAHDFYFAIDVVIARVQK